MSRLRYTDLTGTIGSGGLTNSATSHTFTAPLTYANGVTVPTLSGSDYFLVSVLTSTGAVREVLKVTAYNSGTGAATIARGQEGTSGVAHTSGDKVILAAYPTDFSSGILAVARYAPGTFTSINTTSTSFVDVDATNLVVTFVAPPSGNVVVAQSAYCNAGTTTTIQWCLREGTTTVTNSQVQAVYNNNDTDYKHTLVYITGLTPGTSYTWKWGWRRSTGSSTVTMAFADDAAGQLPAVMVVTAAP